MAQSTYPNNLESLMGSGLTPSLMAMNQQGNAELNDQLEQQRLGIENQFNQQDLPTRLAQSQANLGLTQAKTQETQGLAKQYNAAGDVAQGTKDSDIKAKMSKNITGMSEDEITQHSNMLRGMAGLAQTMEAGYIPSLQEQQAVEAKTPGLLAKLQDPNERQKVIKAYGLWNELAGEHQNKMSEENLKGAWSYRNAVTLANSRVEAAEKRAAAHAGASELLTKALLSKDPEQVANAFSYRAMLKQQDGDQQGADEDLRVAQTYRQRSNEMIAGRRPPGVDVPAVANLPATPVPQAQAPVVPGNNAPKPDPLGIR